MDSLTSNFASFMRSYGIRILYVITVIYAQHIHSKIMTLNIDDNDKKCLNHEFGIWQIVYLWCLRISSLLLFIPSLQFVAVYLFTKLPEIKEHEIIRLFDDDGDRDQNEKRKNSEPINNHPQDNSNTRNRIAHLIIRVITKGDYKSLIKRNIKHHVELFRKSGYCKHLEAHVITENRLDGDYRLNGIEVKEILVPHSYQTPNQSLYRARNLNYWRSEYMMKNKNSRSTDQSQMDQIWILSLDEDAFITEQFGHEFATTFLDSGAVCSVNPTLIDLPIKTASVFNWLEESFFIALNLTITWFETQICRLPPLWFKGGVYVVRLDIENSIPVDNGPRLSVSDDNVFGNYFGDKNYQMGYINAWNWEGGATSTMGLIKQRSRWFRGHLYAWLFQEMSAKRRVWYGIRYFVWYGVDTFMTVLSVIFALTVLTSQYNQFFPLACRMTLLDRISSFAICSVMFANVFGAWYIMEPRRAIMYTVGVLSLVGMIAQLVLHCASTWWALITLSKELYYGRIECEVTEKKKL